MTDLVIWTDRGLYCPEGDFFIDPWRPAAGMRAVITHAHSDHAQRGADTYLCSQACAPLLRIRLGEDASVRGIGYGCARGVRLGGVLVSLHPAGHVLGSAQVRLEGPGGRVWVVTGDYKLAADGVCDRFEPVRCHTLITESTFGLPIYRWPDAAGVAAEINAWWAGCRSAGRTALLTGYALGKAQRLLSVLDASIGPILLHGALERLTEAHRAQGVRLPPTAHAGAAQCRAHAGAAVVLAPPGAERTPWARGLSAGGAEVETAFASGWMLVRGARRRSGVGRGFVLSDHADWPGLHLAIAQSGCERVGVTHGHVRAMVRYLRQGGRDAFEVPGPSGAGPHEAEDADAADSHAAGTHAASADAAGAQAPDSDAADSDAPATGASGEAGRAGEAGGAGRVWGVGGVGGVGGGA